MRPPFPTEKRERNLNLTQDFVNGMSTKELRLKYQIGGGRLLEIIRSTCRCINPEKYRSLLKEANVGPRWIPKKPMGVTRSDHPSETLPIGLIRENRHYFVTETKK